MKKITVLLFTVILCFLYSACSFDNEYPVTLAHTTIQRCPKNIICLSDSVADILMTCGYGDRIIARSEECTQPELSGLTSVGHKHSPSVNSIIDLHPDIVFADKSIPDEAYHTIRNSGIEILIMMPARTGDDLIRLYENIGAIMGGRYKGRENGSQKAESILIALRDLQRTIPSSNIVITSCYLYDLNGHAASDDTLEGKLLSYANTVNICGNARHANDALMTLQMSNPDYIFCAAGLKAPLMADPDYLVKLMKQYLSRSIYKTEIGRWIKYYGLEDPAAFIEDVEWIRKNMQRNKA